MSMTFLELVQRVRQESGSTAAGSSGPSTVVSQTGLYGQMVNWTAEAWNKIQRSNSTWMWMRSRFTFNTTTNIDSYAYTDVDDAITSTTITRFQKWIPVDQYGDSNVLIYTTANGVAGQRYLAYLDWDAFRSLYKRSTIRYGNPVHFTIGPDRKIYLGLVPNDTFTITGEYQKNLQIMTADADVPEMPEDYHMLIVWEALKSYASFAAAPEVYTRAQDEARPLWTALYRNQSPSLSFIGTLA